MENTENDPGNTVPQGSGHVRRLHLWSVVWTREPLWAANIAKTKVKATRESNSFMTQRKLSQGAQRGDAPRSCSALPLFFSAVQTISLKGRGPSSSAGAGETGAKPCHTTGRNATSGSKSPHTYIYHRLQSCPWVR